MAPATSLPGPFFLFYNETEIKKCWHKCWPETKTARDYLAVKQ